MDNFTILANKILKENADSEIDALMRKKFNDAYPADNKSVDPYDEPEMNEDQESGIRSLDGFFSDEEALPEDAESSLTPEDLKTIETVKKLASGEAKGGINPFNNPEKKIQKAYGNILNQVSAKINKIKL
jgi:hypothetical protein